MTPARHVFLELFVAAAIPASAWAQAGIQYDKIEIKTDKVAPNLYMLSGSEGVDPGHPDGAGGRIGVLAGPDGIFMVDSQYLQIGDKVLAAIRRIDAGPIRFLVNTHIHGDHTAGNATFAKLGAVLLAREELREGLALTMKIAGPTTRLVPGHGTYINRTDIIPYRDMILAIQTKVQQLIAQGKTLQEVLAAKVTTPYDAKVPGGLLPAGAAGTSADRFVTMVYSQLKGG